MSDGMKTPTTDGGLRKYDDLPPADAAVRAWVTPGVRPEWDARALRIEGETDDP